jgi:ABC-2 type transport system permease protein
MTMVLFTAVAIVRERERGNLELLINTPVRTPELMAGKILPYIGIGLIQVSLIVWLGVWLFGVPIRGSLLDFYLGSVIFIGASLALGLLISTAAQTQMQAFQMTFFFCYRRSCCLDLCFPLMACHGWRSILPKDYR